jgi:hypothetical protein
MRLSLNLDTWLKEMSMFSLRKFIKNHRRYRLDACPFCGSDRYGDGFDKPRLINDLVTDEHFVHCPGCGARGPWGWDRPTAARMWNKREAA